MNQDNTWKSENPKNLKFLLKNQDIVEKQIRRYLEHKEENPLSSSMNN
jgi:SWI/SNF-related matrix-associated actin-dependent regulator of chromatin subfamily D